MNGPSQNRLSNLVQDFAQKNNSKSRISTNQPPNMILSSKNDKKYVNSERISLERNPNTNTNNSNAQDISKGLLPLQKQKP